jgi:hypothetical protein
MCRSIKPLYNFEPPATETELRAAAVQFVRKVSGFQRPSRDNAAAFNEAVEEITASLHKLIGGLHTKATPRDRAIEAAKARARHAGSSTADA